MFFYLLHNSNLLSNEKENKNKLIKLLVFGTISYILLHGCLFIGDRNAILYEFRSYFWIILVLDCVTMHILNTYRSQSLAVENETMTNPIRNENKEDDYKTEKSQNKESEKFTQNTTEHKPQIKIPIKRSKKINKIKNVSTPIMKNVSTPVMKQSQPIKILDEQSDDKKVTFSNKVEFKNIEDSDSGTDIEDFKNML